MKQPIYDFVMDQLAAARGRWPEVAEGSGVSRRTIEKIARGEIADPGVSHIQKLHDYFRSAELAGRR
jgi:transcriptional regulator with XRE-family HTH domain